MLNIYIDIFLYSIRPSSINHHLELLTDCTDCHIFDYEEDNKSRYFASHTGEGSTSIHAMSHDKHMPFLWVNSIRLHKALSTGIIVLCVPSQNRMWTWLSFSCKSNSGQYQVYMKIHTEQFHNADKLLTRWPLNGVHTVHTNNTNVHMTQITTRHQNAFYSNLYDNKYDFSFNLEFSNEVSGY